MLWSKNRHWELKIDVRVNNRLLEAKIHTIKLAQDL